MFSTTNLNNNIKIQLFIFCLFFGYVSTEKPQTNNPDPDSTVSSFLSKVVQLPQISIVNGELIFSCPSTDSYSNLEEYTSFFSQVGTFIPITGLLFTIAVYGTKSIFGIMTTCFLDDIVIFTSSFGAIFWWYTFAKPFWLTAVTRAMEMDSNYDYSPYSIFSYRHIFSAIFKRFEQVNADKGLNFVVIYFVSPVKIDATEAFTVFNTLLVTVLTRSIASFFTDNGVIECTYKHGDDEKVFSEIKAGNINEVVYFYKNDKMDKNDKTEPDKWISEPILREVRKMTKADKNCPLEHHNCEQIKGFMKDIEHGLRYNKSGEPKKNSFFRNSLLKMNNKVDVKKTEVENTEEPKKNTEVKVKKVQVKRMEAEDKVLINILETGFLNYFIYSHRKDRDGSYDEYGNYDENEYKYEFEISEVHKKC
ncbi:16529_t:CDS:2 [Entrophospora sp. SA101]|nr:16529_t:CDS:2 [Entrophospora sp. SA101]